MTPDRNCTRRSSSGSACCRISFSYLNADSFRLAQVFGNLLSNVSKFMEPGGRIWLTAERQGSDVVVSVKDTGIGISPRPDREHLRDVFAGRQDAGAVAKRP